MTIENISHNNSQRLIVLFLGWGMDATPFRSLSKPGYDIMAISNYTGYLTPVHDEPTCFDKLADIAATYSENVVVAWSFGVRIAADFLQLYRKRLPITRAIAVNGTMQHISDTQGIPTDIFNGTLANLSDENVAKFRRRMLGGKTAYMQFLAHTPQRTFESLQQELSTFAQLPPLPESTLWDYAIVGDADMIFPVDNQLRAWSNTPTDIVPTMPHYPNLQTILNKYIVDKELVAQRFGSTRQTYSSNASMQQSVAAQLWHITQPYIEQMPPSRPDVLEVGVGNGNLTALYSSAIGNANLQLWDIATLNSEAAIPPTAIVKCCDAETEIRRTHDNSFDIILSASTLQWFNSPTEFIGEVARTLRPNGLCALALYGPDTFREIATATGESLKYPTLEALTSAATRAGLKILAQTSNNIVFNFKSIPEMLQHIKSTGVNAVSRTEHTAGNAALKLLRHYPIAPDGTVPLTYQALYLVVRKS